MSTAAFPPVSECRAVVVMGVSGCGKSTVGAALARRLGARFTDADDLHPPENVEKMRAGIPLTDEDRAPWLERVGQALAGDGGTRVIACSALRRAYRDRIASAAGRAVIFVHLDGSKELIAGRLRQRKGHYMPASLLDSQFAALEPLAPDEPGLTVAIDPPPEEIAASLARALTQ